MNTYPENYKVKPVEEQYEILKKFFPKLPKLPKTFPDKGDSDGLFVIPHWNLVGKTYEGALGKVLGFIKKQRPFKNYREGKLGENYLRETELKSRNMPEGLMILPAQFGLKHKGKSVEDVRKNLESNEIPLGAYEVGIMILTHPERLQGYDDLWIDCPGDEYAPDADGGFVSAPIFNFRDGGLGFYTDWFGHASAYYGSVSAFLPQYRNLSIESSNPVAYLILEIGGKRYKIQAEEF